MDIFALIFVISDVKRTSDYRSAHKVVVKPISGCAPNVFCHKSETSCYHLITRLMTVADLLQVVPTRLLTISFEFRATILTVPYSISVHHQHQKEIRLGFFCSVPSKCPSSISLHQSSSFQPLRTVVVLQ